MENDLAVLKQKFVNFKKFIAEIAKDSDKKTMLLNQSEDDMVNRSVLLYVMFKKLNSVDLIVNTTCLELGIDKPDDKEKLRRYFQCFIDYNKLIHKDQQVNLDVKPEDEEKFRALIKNKLELLKPK